MLIKKIYKIKNSIRNYFFLYSIAFYSKLINNKNNFYVNNYINKIFRSFIRFLKYLLKSNNNFNFYLIGEDYINWTVDQLKVDNKYFLKLNKIHITKNLIKTTHLFCLNYDLLLLEINSWIKFLKKILNFKIIAYINNDLRHFKWKIGKLKDIVDIWVSASKTIYSFLEQYGLKTVLIPFYVNEKDFFNLNKSKKQLCDILQIDFKKIENRLIIGSFQRDSLETLLKPKWQKNPDLLINILKKIPNKEYALLLAGPRRHYIIKKCEENNITYIYYGDFNYIKTNKDDIKINVHPLNIINLLYNLSDIYIVTSKSEGGPKAIMEASLSKTLIFSTDVGLAKDYLHEDLIFSENNIVKIINLINQIQVDKKKLNYYLNYNFNNVYKIFNENSYKKLYISLLF